jgi:putative ABC transport system substrate-binding protein
VIDKVTKGLLAIMFLVIASFADAQQVAKVRSLGLLSNGSPALGSALRDAFRQRLRELGYEEGRDISFEYRYAEGKLERLPGLAAELVHLNVDLIVTTGGTPAPMAAKNATRTIPIIFLGTDDPVAGGLVASFARPGGNLTGLTNGGPELSAKRLEILKETVPKVSRVAFLSNVGNPGSGDVMKEIEAAARALGIRLQPVGIRSANDLEEAFSQMIKERAGALAVRQEPLLTTLRERIVELAAKNKLPAIYAFTEFLDVGGLMSYGPSRLALRLAAATYVDKILKGAKPADLPVQQPIKFEFIINLKAAKQIGLTIPPNVLARADRVIK